MAGRMTATSAIKCPSLGRSFNHSTDSDFDSKVISLDALLVLADSIGYRAVLALLIALAPFAWWVIRQRQELDRERTVELQDRLRRLGGLATAGAGKPIRHYVLIWWRNKGDWATSDWSALQDYVATFQPTVGFSRVEALSAEMVTIVGAASGIDDGAELDLKAAGCKVERLDGKHSEHTAELLRRRVQANKAFEGGRHRLGY